MFDIRFLKRWINDILMLYSRVSFSIYNVLMFYIMLIQIFKMIDSLHFSKKLYFCYIFSLYRFYRFVYYSFYVYNYFICFFVSVPKGINLYKNAKYQKLCIYVVFMFFNYYFCISLCTYIITFPYGGFMTTFLKTPFHESVE